MNLKTRITEDMKSAMRARETDRLATIRLLLAACKQKEVDERVELDDNAVIGIIDRLVKQRKDSIAAFAAAQRQDLVDKESAELAVLEAYLPRRLSADELAAAVRALAERLAAELGRRPGAADMGRMMALAKAELAGKADMGQVSGAVKAALQP